MIQQWYEESNITTGPLLPPELRNRYLRILFTYRDLDARELSDIPATDLYVHRVRLTQDTLPYASKRRMRRSTQQSFWLNKVIQEGIAHGMYESTAMANGKLSDWNADAVVVAKPGQASLASLLLI